MNASSNMDEIEIEIYQGDNPDGSDGQIMIEDCAKVADMVLSGFEKRKAGESKIRVKLEVDSDGLLKVSATDVARNKTENINVKDKMKLTEVEV